MVRSWSVWIRSVSTASVSSRVRSASESTRESVRNSVRGRRRAGGGANPAAVVRRIENYVTTFGSFGTFGRSTPIEGRLDRSERWRLEFPAGGVMADSVRLVGYFYVSVPSKARERAGLLYARG